MFDLSGVGFRVLPGPLVHLDQLRSASSTEFDLNWVMTLNPHFIALELQHQYSGSVPGEYFKPSVSLFVDDEKKWREREREAEKLFLMSCMRCDVELKYKCWADFFFFQRENLFSLWILSAVVCSLLMFHPQPSQLRSKRHPPSKLRIVYTWFTCLIKIYCVVNAFHNSYCLSHLKSDGCTSEKMSKKWLCCVHLVEHAQKMLGLIIPRVCHEIWNVSRRMIFIHF